MTASQMQHSSLLNTGIVMANQFDTLDLSTVPHNPVAESLVQIICQKTQNTAPLFYRILVAYYLTKVASMMRCKIRNFWLR
jgi:hypothetical protein